jgi:hypothetical protein
MPTSEETEGEKIGGFLRGFFLGLFRGPHGIMLLCVLVGNAVYFGPRWADKQSAVYWEDKDIQQMMRETIRQELAPNTRKLDRVAVMVDAMVRAQTASTRLRVLEEMAQYDSRQKVNP